MNIIVPYEMLGSNRVVLALSDFEDLMDALAYDTAKDSRDETFPHSVTEQLFKRTESSLKIFREYRNLTQESLASQSGISQALLSEIESGKKQGSIDTLKSIAAILKVDLDDIV